MKIRSTFGKVFSLVVIMTLIMLLLFSTVVISLVYEYSISEKRDALTHDATRISKSMSLLYENYSAELYNVVMANVIAFLQNTDSYLAITDESGEVLYSNAASPSNENNTSVIVPSQYIESIVQNGKYSGIGTLGRLYQDSVYSVGMPIASDGKNIGYVFLSSPTPYTKDMLFGIIRIIFNASVLVFLAALGTSYLLASWITRPLKLMSHAAREYGKGNFEVRVPIDSDDEFGELAMAFNNMAASLEQLETMRSGFIANVSHDLRTPMTTISGFIDGILDGTIPREKEEYYLKLVADEVRRLSRMVKGLLDVARFESKQAVPKRTKFDLCAMVGTILVGFEKRINEKNVYVEVHFEKDDEPMNVDADYDMIFQVVYNLLDNAVKFVNKDGILSVTVETEQKKTRCRIRNTGSGISAEDMKHIFDRFFKSDSSRSLDRNGVGLGLYIVRSIIIAHEETVNVDSVEGQYTEFSFTLPSA